DYQKSPSLKGARGRRAHCSDVPRSNVYPTRTRTTHDWVLHFWLQRRLLSFLRLQEMKKKLFALLMSLSLLNACYDDAFENDVRPVPDSTRTTAAASVTGLTRFTMNNLNIPSGGLSDGRRFYTGG